jgi:hypothetical protein
MGCSFVELARSDPMLKRWPRNRLIATVAALALVAAVASSALAQRTAGADLIIRLRLAGDNCYRISHRLRLVYGGVELGASESLEP